MRSVDVVFVAAATTVDTAVVVGAASSSLVGLVLGLALAKVGSEVPF